ncbi:MAG: GNAT family N-acetyltransferase [Candidatus Hodarchaeales archaeon]
MDRISGYRIRKMEAGDFTEIRDLWEKCGIKLAKSDEPAELKRMLDHNPGLCFVTIRESDGTIVGAVLGGFDGRRGWVHHLAVDPQEQRKKLGSLMMAELTNQFKRMKVVRIKLEIYKDNLELIEFYKKLGWNPREQLFTMSLDP